MELSNSNFDTFCKKKKETIIDYNYKYKCLILHIYPVVKCMTFKDHHPECFVQNTISNCNRVNACD